MRTSLNKHEYGLCVFWCRGRALVEFHHDRLVPLQYMMVPGAHNGTCHCTVDPLAWSVYFVAATSGPTGLLLYQWKALVIGSAVVLTAFHLVQFVVCCLSCTVCCVLFVVYCLLCAVCCMLWDSLS